MRVLYLVPSVRAAALICRLQPVRAVRFFSLRPRNLRRSPCKSASFAARSFDLRPQRKPFVSFKSFSRFLCADTPRFTRGMLVVQNCFHRESERARLALVADIFGRLASAKMIHRHGPTHNLAVFGNSDAFCRALSHG